MAADGLWMLGEENVGTQKCTDASDFGRRLSGGMSDGLLLLSRKRRMEVSRLQQRFSARRRGSLSRIMLSLERAWLCNLSNLWGQWILEQNE